MEMIPYRILWSSASPHDKVCPCYSSESESLSETKLDATVDSTEFLTSAYRGDIRKDRDRKGGGVMIATKSSLTVECVEIPDTCDTVWAKIMDKQNNPSPLAHSIVDHMNIHQLRSLNWKK